jgi:hypothetical protein
MKRLMNAGTGFVMLHQSVDIPDDHADEMKSWLGAAFQKDIGCRGHWDMEFKDFPQHPITRGVSTFSAPFDGWLFNLHFADGVTPLLSAPVPDTARTTADAKSHAGRPEVVAWAYERPNGGRSFAFTGCDLHRNWSFENQRRFVTNGILWTAKVEVPNAGAPVSFNPAALAANLDSKPGQTAKPLPPLTPAQ